MPYEDGKLAEIVDDSEDSEKETNFWPQDRMVNIEGEAKNLRFDIDEASRHLGRGYPAGLEYSLRNKNEIDPGHEHLFPPRNKTVIFSQFESLDGWSQGGVGTETITTKLGGTSLATGASANDDAWIIASGATTDTFDVSQPSAFQSVLKFSAATTVTGYFGVGDITAGGAFGAANEEGYGFKYASGTLSALTVKNGTENLITISGITATNFNEYRAIYDGKSVNFFVNSRLRARTRASMPDTDDDVFATFYVKATAVSAARTLYVKYLYFVQVNA